MRRIECICIHRQSSTESLASHVESCWLRLQADMALIQCDAQRTMTGHFILCSVSSLPLKATLVFEDFHAAILQRVGHGHRRSSLGLSATAVVPATRGKPTDM